MNHVVTGAGGLTSVGATTSCKQMQPKNCYLGAWGCAKTYAIGKSKLCNDNLLKLVKDPRSWPANATIAAGFGVC